MTGAASSGSCGSCGSCGTDLRDDARFCHECGASTATSAYTAEFKQVTVLFADVVRSMDIAVAVGAERLREIMAQLACRGAAVVKRYGGTMEKFSGDGLMALFGAPVALEDHAIRACLAALDIQVEAGHLAAEVQHRDNISLRLRVGLNSGPVVAGEIGSGLTGYAAIGETVGYAQRMESVAPHGGVLLSEATAQLVEHAATLEDIELVSIKGRDQPVRVRQLLAIGPRDGVVERAEGSLVGRRWEMAALDAIVGRAIGGQGGLVNVVGPPGIGKSRVARETAALAAGRGAEVFWAFCESHASDIPFHVAAQLLRTTREHLRAAVPDADPEDLLLLDDLLGFADAEVPLPQIDPEARRRRLTALINTATLARTEPALFIIEDAHWIDAASESMLADFLTVVPRTLTMVLITSRPEYQGALTRLGGAHAIALAPLSNSDTSELIAELLGSDPSVAELAAIIVERAAGNPFFAEEMVRELAQRGVLAGERGSYSCHTNAADFAVPATVQAAIEARIDRLSTPAKHTLHAASVIGTRFNTELLAALDADEAFDELLHAELIDQVRFTPTAEYAFRHPLIRAVAYESQLKSGRNEWHRRLAAAIQRSGPGMVDENAALIAEHLEAAGELEDAYAWHMRAGTWSTSRDLDAARLSWERAYHIADALPADDPDLLSRRIAPRTMLCATDYQGPTIQQSRGRFAELRELCNAAGDKVSPAIGMTGLVTELGYAGRTTEGSRLASEQMALLESIGDPTPCMALAFVGFANWSDAGEWGELLRWSQTVVDLAAGDPTKGAAFGIGSPLAIALTWRGIARYWLGRPRWRQDLRDAVAIARRSNHARTLVAVLTWTHGWGIHYGVLRADDDAVHAIEEAVQTAERTSDDIALSVAEYGLGGALLNRDAMADRHRGLELMVQARNIFRRKQAGQQMLPVIELWVARERARRGDRDGAIPVMRKSVNGLHEAGRLGFGVPGTGFLVETLLERGAEGDLAEARQSIDRLANLCTDHTSAMADITLMRLRALLARAHGDDAAYRILVDRYRAMAESLGFEGHIDRAEEMLEAVHG